MGNRKANVFPEPVAESKTRPSSSLLASIVATCISFSASIFKLTNILSKEYFFDFMDAKVTKAAREDGFRFGRK
jgi:hypothetical protein